MQTRAERRFTLHSPGPGGPVPPEGSATWVTWVRTATTSIATGRWSSDGHQGVLPPHPHRRRRDEVDAWYGPFLAPALHGADWLESEKRWASLSMVGDLVIEVIEPSCARDAGSPSCRFRTRFGQHYHSLAWYADRRGSRRCSRTAAREDIRIAKPGGGLARRSRRSRHTIVHPSQGHLRPARVRRTSAYHWVGRRPPLQPGWSGATGRDEPSPRHPPGVPLHHDRRRPRRAVGASTTEALAGKELHRSPPDADRESIFVSVGTGLGGRAGPARRHRDRLADDLRRQRRAARTPARSPSPTSTRSSATSEGGRAGDRSAGDTLTLDPDDCSAPSTTSRPHGPGRPSGLSKRYASAGCATAWR